MSIKVKLGTVVNAVESKALAAIANMDGLSAKAAYDAAKLIRKVEAEYKAFTAGRDMLIKNLGEKDEKGNPAIQPGTPAMQAFAEEIGKLAESDVELRCSKVRLPAPKGDEPCGLKPVHLIICEDFIEIPGVTDAAEEAKDGDAKKSEEGAQS